MFKYILILICLCFLLGCGEIKNIDGKYYNTYGLLNQNNIKNPNIHYEIIVGNVIWTVILCETIIFPIYFIGFSLYQAECLEKDYNPLNNGLITDKKQIKALETVNKK